MFTAFFAFVDVFHNSYIEKFSVIVYNINIVSSKKIKKQNHLTHKGERYACNINTIV